MAVENYTNTAQDIIDSVVRQFGDEAGSQINQSDIIRWINEAQRDIIVANREINQAIATFASVAGQGIYDITLLIPDVLRIHSIAYKNRMIEMLSFEEAQTRMMESDVAGDPNCWFKYAGQLNLWPAPDSDLEDVIKVYYNRSPSIVTQGTDPLSVPQSYYEAINAFCLKKAYELDGDAQMLGIKNEDYNRNLTLNSLDNSNSYREFPTIRFVED